MDTIQQQYDTAMLEAAESYRRAVGQALEPNNQSTALDTYSSLPVPTSFAFRRRHLFSSAWWRRSLLMHEPPPFHFERGASVSVMERREGAD